MLKVCNRCGNKYKRYHTCRVKEFITKSCKNCNNLFQSNNDCQVHCSNKCKNEWKSNNRSRRSYTYTCVICGIEYHPREKIYNKCCGKECSYEYVALIRKISGQQNQIIKALNAPIENLIDTLKKIKHCPICNIKFIGRSKTCSYKCKSIYEYESYVGLNPRKCKWCDIIFKPLRYAGVYEWCCLEHKKLYERKQKQINKKNNPNTKLHKGGVSKAKRIRVWERDGYICMLCNNPLRMDTINTLGTNIPHALAPTVDHIIPVSMCKKNNINRSEMNSESNLQSAHYICNSRKGNRVQVNCNKG
jgi:predicted nucleic acid-binding Zn ribbon protein